MMKRVVTFGKQPASAPKHNFAEIHFPELAKLDVGTNEGMISRILSSEGGDTRSLPRTIYFQKTQAPGHDDSVAIGSLHEVTIDGETGIASGKGWMVDTEAAREAAVYVEAKALFHNSVDLAEVKVEITEHGDFWDDDFRMDVLFTEWKIGATTLVGKPAFADAHATIETDLTAAIEAGPLVVDCPSTLSLVTPHSDEEILASAAGLPSWDHFHRPEPDAHHKIVVGVPDEDGWIPVYGHLSLWNTCHDGIEGRCTMTPRPQDNYASFNKPSVLTDKGQVEAGPISLYGGHIPLHKAADDPANAWCDVRVIAGVHGPWLSGVVRPHVAEDDAKVYVARASRISGHWKGARLKMIVSCNAEGFDVPGSGFSFSTNADGEVAELVASYPGCAEPQASQGFKPLPSYLTTMDPLTPEQQSHLIQWSQSTNLGNLTYTTTTTTEFEIDDDEIIVDNFDAEIERQRRIRQLDLLGNGSSDPRD
ncbi:MAG: hypothetical protein HKN93_05625 [Acidimicrobiia bacterium]|nr:hypothetical protein [Acidimicrobiia bacterium]